MIVVHLGYKYGVNNTGGAAVAATRLHLALLKAGVESHYITIFQCEDGPNIHVLPGGFARGLFFLLTKALRGFGRFSSLHKSVCLNLVPLFGLERLLRRINPNVVHVQWINADVCSLNQLSKLPYRLVFNLHDLYMVNALEPHSNGDLRFRKGFTKANSSFLERWMFNRKQHLVHRGDVMFVGPSDWVVKACQSSLIGHGIPSMIISNLPDPIFRYCPEQRKAHKKFVVLFGCFRGTENSFKGWDDLEAAVHLLVARGTAEFEVHVFGEAAEDYYIGGILIHFLGIVRDSRRLLEIYHLADLLAFPSRMETQGMTKIEALLCGLPVVAFSRTACAEGVIGFNFNQDASSETAGRVGDTPNGWIAPDGDVESFADGIAYFINRFRLDDYARLQTSIAEDARCHYSEQKLVAEACDFYQSESSRGTGE